PSWVLRHTMPNRIGNHHPHSQCGATTIQLISCQRKRQGLDIVRPSKQRGWSNNSLKHKQSLQAQTI
ncbi:hypothetical protein KI387_006350, partial [Taxus chinensis]